MKLDAIQYIPHEQPMVFIDHLVEANDGYAIAELTIRPELMFCEAAGLPTWTSIEIMAQTISAYSGWMGQQLQQAPKVGFLLGTRKLQLPFAYFAVGQTLKIRVEQQYLHEGLGQFSCEIHCNEQVISAMLSVYEPTDPSTQTLSF
ncbi:ApeP family dehydratase [Acinetobacter vivianii]|uniref:ApeP family dehydratase n=1 Tax=Acinetobacter vivianii TaxID=1776742 RepID=UPI002DBBA0B0|nr:3-hydroxylacyl-ACP dehydratase [Acinetobacter vivianii]MEB6480396.1 3-hydroxylacyl-ACP dehydratase [Acinetobacter vivianii]MEB6658843.1 3-hydroxylacyl-ACP dehydratase [Acinetobacter vivianii]